MGGEMKEKIGLWVPCADPEPPGGGPGTGGFSGPGSGGEAPVSQNLDRARSKPEPRQTCGRIRQGLILLTALACCLGPAALAQGAGFAVLQQGTAAMAQGNAFVAEADDASAIFYNPAGLNQLKRPQFYQGGFFNYPDREFHGDQGQFSETHHQLYQHLTAYMALPVHDRVALGIGFFSPFGLGTNWPRSWAGRYLTTFSSLKTYVLNPVVSVKVLDNLSLAAGIDAMWSSVELRRKNFLAVLPGGKIFEGESHLMGDASGVGYNLGVLFDAVPGVKLGVSYRSEIPVTFQGNLETSIPGHSIPLIGGYADLTFPPSVTFGVAYSRLKPFTFEFDTTWTGWSTYDQLRVELGQKGKTLLGASSIVTPKNWRDAWAFRFGANYEVKPGMKLRAGYIYDLTPVPDETFDPQVPDANRHIFTVGGDLKIKRFTLGVAYNYILSEDRTKNNTIKFNGVPAYIQANGRYSSDVHSLGLSWSFQF
jgi:long-chain fatty acid transport protein